MTMTKSRNAALLALLLGTGGAVRAQTTPINAQATASVAQQQAEWTARLNKIGASDWRVARGEVAPLAGVAPGRAIALIRALWPTLTSASVKDELLRAFTQSEHPDSLAILSLVAGDADMLKTNRQSLEYQVRMTLLLPLDVKLEDALPRLRAVANRPLDAVRRERMGEITRHIADMPSDSIEFLAHTLNNTNETILRTEGTKCGLRAALEKRLMTGKDGPRPQQCLLEILACFELPEATLERVVLPFAANADEGLRAMSFGIMAHAGYGPGYAALKRKLSQSAEQSSFDNRTLTQSAADYGRADIIPSLIGLIAADNTSNTIYNVGYSGLTPLTGVAYDPLHDGNWWRLWWERNHDKLPADAGSLSVPELPHTAAYQAPLARELHLDPVRYREYCLDKLRDSLRASGKDGGSGNLETRSLVSLHDATLIPMLIGMIASDNTVSTYRLGYEILAPLTGVPYDATHDGSWWRLWWEQHRGELPPDVRALPVPDLPHTAVYHEPLNVALHHDPAALRVHLLAELRKAIAPDAAIATNNTVEITFLVNSIVGLNDPNAIAPLIEMLPDTVKSDADKNALYYLSWFGLHPLTNAPYDANQARAGWRQWLAAHRAEIDKRIADFHPQPSYITLKYSPQERRDTSPFVTQAGYNPRVAPKLFQSPVQASAAKPKEDPEPEDVRDIASQLIKLRDDPQRVYRLVGLKAAQAAPAGGYKLLVVLPGGDGSDEFRWFVRRMKANALPDDMLIAQIIAPNWSAWQANNLVWPTRANPFYGMKFSTEDLIEEAIADAAKRTHIDPKQVYALAWSSSGPAVYTALASAHSSLRGAFVAMSVFRAGELPAPALLKDRRVFLYHSPQDFIKITQAQEAETYLRAHGASVQLRQYQGGHGWTGDTYGDIRAGLDWLTQTDKKP